MAVKVKVGSPIEKRMATVEKTRAAIYLFVVAVVAAPFATVSLFGIVVVVIFLLFLHQYDFLRRPDHDEIPRAVDADEIPTVLLLLVFLPLPVWIGIPPLHALPVELSVDGERLGLAHPMST